MAFLKSSSCVSDIIASLNLFQQVSCEWKVSFAELQNLPSDLSLQNLLPISYTINAL